MVSSWQKQQRSVTYSPICSNALERCDAVKTEHNVHGGDFLCGLGIYIKTQYCMSQSTAISRSWKLRQSVFGEVIPFGGPLLLGL